MPRKSIEQKRMKYTNFILLTLLHSTNYDPHLARLLDSSSTIQYLLHNLNSQNEDHIYQMYQSLTILFQSEVSLNF